MAALAAARIPKLPPPIVADLATNLSGDGWMDRGMQKLCEINSIKAGLEWRRVVFKGNAEV
jgi:hypothetical protein